MKTMLLSLALGGLSMATACGPADAGPVPSELAAPLDETMLGTPTFDERFERLDAGSDQLRGPAPHRWRTVMGYGGPTAFSNYRISDSSIAVDPSFTGVENGRPGTRPLGLNPFQLDPGRSLTILARPVPAGLAPKLWNARYYSGQLTTKFSFSQLYGYFEIEAMLPVGKGFWPSFWLLPTKGQWPAGGEIDVFEGLGDPRSIYTTLHWGREHQQAQRKITLAFDASTAFHRYGVAWSRQYVVWYVDRREAFRVPTPPEMREPMFLLMGLGVGGPWGGYPDQTTRFPGRYVIRRVRAWTLRQVP